VEQKAAEPEAVAAGLVAGDYRRVLGQTVPLLDLLDLQRQPRQAPCRDTADIGKDFAKEIREYHIPDFSNWNDNDSFEAAFDRLLKDLKAEASTGSSTQEAADPETPH
jgi:hypothetical protein